MFTTTLILILFAYLCGSINSAILTCMVLRLPSPRTIGSGNPGTTNVLRLGGKKAAAITLIGDVLKGLIPVLIGHFFKLNNIDISIICLAAILGHMFPIFFGFKGGKGVATLIGVMFGFYWILGIAFIVTWLIIALITRYSSLSALIATLEVPFVVYFLFGPQPSYIFAIITIIIFIKHHQNIKKLLIGKERKIGK